MNSSSQVNPKRIFSYKKIDRIYKGPVVYWMQRDQRAEDNWALLFAQEIAIDNSFPLIVVFCLANNFLDATIRQYDFMIKGLQETKEDLESLNIPFNVLIGKAPDVLPTYLSQINASVLVSDFNPLKITLEWKKKVADKIEIPFYEIDSHNIFPCRFISNKQEFAAYTFRPKTQKLMGEFLTEIPKLEKMPEENLKFQTKIDWKELYASLKVNFEVKPVDHFIPGKKAAFKILDEFISKKIKFYAAQRNDPNANVVSNLSPYLHFGQISPQRVAFETSKLNNDENVAAFLEELIVRRELADNFCFYNINYDNVEGFPEWARRELAEIEKYPKEFIYNLKDFECAKTHDDLWNAAQLEMIKTGKMSGYMRMYWAKKILEWSPNVQTALKIAIYLNDKYELDGRDPNGYTGIAWSIGGVHDRPFYANKIFGKIRYMSRLGCEKKFEVEKYIKRNLEKTLFEEN